MVGFWTKEQFQSWTVDYLRSLWTAGVPDLSTLALTALKPILEQNPEVCLSSVLFYLLIIVYNIYTMYFVLPIDHCVPYVFSSKFEYFIFSCK